MTTSESKGRFFFTERIDSHNESIRIANWNALLRMAQLMPLTVFCFSKIQIGYTFLVPAHPEKGPLNVCCAVLCCTHCLDLNF